MSFQAGDIAKVKVLHWWHGWNVVDVAITEDDVRYISDGNHGLVVCKTDGSRQAYVYEYDRSQIAIWLRAPATPDPKQQRPAH